MTENVPAYDSLPIRPDLPPASAWEVFGKDDRLGTLNLLGGDRLTYAAGLVRKGAVFSLNWDVSQPNPPILGRRSFEFHYEKQYAGWDDYYDVFYPQLSTQWDALNHVHHRTHRYYNGNSESVSASGEVTPPLGIDDFAKHGIAGRFVLLDVARHRAEQGRPFDYMTKDPVTVAELEEIAAKQSVEFRDGDILMLRFGWIGWYEQQSDEVKASLATGEVFPDAGLAQGEDTARWLWDHHFAAVVSDNPTLEATPFDQTFDEGFLHYRLIPLLGLAVGELFVMDALADDCVRDGVYEGLFTAAPLNVQGGAGSPGNALAIK